MNRIVNRCSDDARRKRLRVEPILEALEDRRVLSTGNGWYNPIRITYSFVPDGTSVGGVASNLYQKLNTVAPTATWQQIFQKAAAIWQQVAGFNLALVSDSGAAIGTTGYQQGDSRFGDIRIAGTPMGAGTLAYTISPPPINGGTDAGDIVVNTSTVNWQINNDYDLLTVAIHEFGHSLGMGHSAITQADMYASYTSMKQTLHSDDITGIQTLYGAVPSDPTANTTMATSIDLTPLINGSSQIAYGAGFVTNVSDYEWYKVTVPGTITYPPTVVPMTVKMQTNDLSSLAPRLAMFNSAGGSIGQAIDVNKYGSTVTMTIANASASQVYYIRASAANSGAGSNGAFGLLVNFTNNTQAPIPPPNTQVASAPDQGGGSMPQSTTAGKGHRGNHHHAVANPHEVDHDHIVVRIGGKQKLADALIVGQVRPRRLPAQRKHY